MSHLAYPTVATYPQGSQWSRVLKSFVLHTQCPCSSQQYTTALASFPIALLANVIWHATTSTNLYNALWRPFCHTRFEYGFGPKTLFCWSWCSPQIYRFSFAYDKFDYFGGNRDLMFGGHFAHPLTDLKNSFVRTFRHMPSTNPPSFSPLGLAISESIG